MEKVNKPLLKLIRQRFLGMPVSIWTCTDRATGFGTFYASSAKGAYVAYKMCKDYHTTHRRMEHR